MSLRQLNRHERKTLGIIGKLNPMLGAIIVFIDGSREDFTFGQVIDHLDAIVDTIVVGMETQTDAITI